MFSYLVINISMRHFSIGKFSHPDWPNMENYTTQHTYQVFSFIALYYWINIRQAALDCRQACCPVQFSMETVETKCFLFVEEFVIT